ncbi:MAG TPA: hypothetical protein ENK21_06545 [Trueperaceae bacterium]|nr:hypothetical protein [Trueperaceae bacterium]
MSEAIAVKFDNGPVLHYIETSGEFPVIGTKIVVNNHRGLELAEVRANTVASEETNGSFVRIATEQDIADYEENKKLAEDLKWYLKAKARGYSEPIKIVALEFNLDQSLLVVSYTSKGRVPYGSYAKELKRFVDTRIEFIHVGPRDQTRILGTLGVCGSGACSNTWMQGFNAVSIRLARDQQLPLNLDKITGNCGRLMCCLQFEHGMYEELLKDMPRKGSTACHSDGNCGVVSKLFPLKQTVEIRSKGKSLEYPVSELEISKTPRPSQQGSELEDN